MSRGSLKLDIRMQKNQERRKGSTGQEWRQMGEGTEDANKDQDKQHRRRAEALSCSAGPENGPPQTPPPSIHPIRKVLATCCCNNMVTICPGTTEKLNTLDRMVHPDVLARNTAPSGLKAELPPHLMGMRSPSLPPSRES